MLPTDKEKQANTGVEQVKAVVRACQWPMQDYGFTTATKNPIKHIQYNIRGKQTKIVGQIRLMQKHSIRTVVRT